MSQFENHDNTKERVENFSPSDNSNISKAAADAYKPDSSTAMQAVSDQKNSTMAKFENSAPTFEDSSKSTNSNGAVAREANPNGAGRDDKQAKDNKPGVHERPESQDTDHQNAPNKSDAKPSEDNINKRTERPGDNQSNDSRKSGTDLPDMRNPINDLPPEWRNNPNPPKLGQNPDNNGNPNGKPKESPKGGGGTELPEDHPLRRLRGWEVPGWAK